MIVIHHNPDCGTSRNVLAIIKAAGYDPIIVDYLSEGWTRSQLSALLAAAGLSPRDALRETKSPAEKLGLLQDGVSDAVIFEQMLKHPLLVNRPIVCTAKGVKLCRPSEAVLQLLEHLPPHPFYKEDGEPIDMPPGPNAQEFHASIRVMDLSESIRFYSWFLGVAPKDITDRFATFIRPDLNLNFVLMVSDGKTLHHDTLYHLGVNVSTKADVVETYNRALAIGTTVFKPPRTTWRGTPLHELWLKDPDGTLIEIYARLTEDEISDMPKDKNETYLVEGTEPKHA